MPMSAGSIAQTALNPHPGAVGAYLDIVATLEAMLEELGMTQDDFELIDNAPFDEYYYLMCGCIVEGRLARIESSCGRPEHCKTRPHEENV